MLTINECKEKLKNDEKEYSDEEVQAIRDYLYTLASINIDFIKEKQKGNEQKSDNIHQSLNG